MKALRISLCCALALLGFSRMALADSWHVAEDIRTQTCYRVTAPPHGGDWRDLGTFNTFREAGAWIWQNQATCANSPVFN